MAVIRKKPTVQATKKEEIVEVETVVAEVKKPAVAKTAVSKKPAVAKTAVSKTQTKATTKKTETTKKVDTTKNLDLSTEPRVVEIGVAGTLKRDDLIFLVKERLGKEYKIELGTLENASRVIKAVEDVLTVALENSNTVHLCGRNFNRKKVKSRIFNPPIGDGASYLVKPHYKMAYSLELSESIKGQFDDATKEFTAEDGTVYTADDLLALNVELFGEEAE